MIDISFFDMDDRRPLIYSVMVTMYRGLLVTVRHNERTTWEVPGGHIEPGEHPDEAAARELKEETGALEAHVEAVCDYGVAVNGGPMNYGRLYYCEIIEIGPLGESEIAEVQYTEALPSNLTYKDIQPHLFERIMRYLEQKEK